MEVECKDVQTVYKEQAIEVLGTRYSLNSELQRKLLAWIRVPGTEWKVPDS